MIIENIKKDFCADFEIFVSTYLPQVEDYVEERQMVYEADWEETMELLDYDLIEIPYIIDALFEQDSPHLDMLAMEKETYCKDGKVWWSDEAVDYVTDVLAKQIKEEFQKYQDRQLRIWKNRKK